MTKYNSLLLRCNSWNDFVAEVSKFDNTTDVGNCFELLNKYYLLLHPEYRTIIDDVWLLNEVPAEVANYLNLPENDEGIDSIARTKDGEYWSIQSKYISDTSRSITRKYVSTFTDLSFNICKNITFALVCTTASKASRKFDMYANRVGFCFSDIWEGMSQEFFTVLHNYIQTNTYTLEPYTPRHHQIQAIDNTIEYFKNTENTRGKIIMPTGTGKSLAGFWIFQALDVKTVLITVPSLALIKQMLEVWSREALANNIGIDWIAICSDESVEPDSSIGNTQDLGLFVETDVNKLASKMKNLHSGKLIVFSTYQSSEATCTAAKLAGITFDLGIFDEAHKTVGRKGKLFSAMLYDANVRIKKRIFMTATERVYRGSSDDILSMDDPTVYGEDIHVMSFKSAIEYDPPILSDYSIVTINVLSSDIKNLIENNSFVFPQKKGWSVEVQAEMLASLIALHKAMKKYPIKHVVSFHGSIEKANIFQGLQDIFTHSYSEFKPLDVFHVKGLYSTAKRKQILNKFANAKRSLVTNARCLTEGVDVPSIDGILFADPKKSTVDIVQAIGRALRTSKGKERAYIIIPVIIEDESIKESSYETILYMLRALASQDERIIDYFRSGQSSKRTNKDIDIQFEVLQSLSINPDQFKEALETKLWNKLAKLSWMPFEEAKEFIQLLGLKTNTEWLAYCKGEMPDLSAKPDDIPSNPNTVYKDKGWKGLGDWLGTGIIASQRREYRSFAEAKKFVQSLGLKSGNEWRAYCKGEMPDFSHKPDDIPMKPQRTYKDKGWKGMGDWLGTGTVATQERKYRLFVDAKKFIQSLGLKTGDEWKAYCKGEMPDLPPKPDDIPANPNTVYKDKGWKSIGDWLGTGMVATQERKYRSFADAKKFVQSLEMESSNKWSAYCKGEMPDLPPKPDDIPSAPHTVYKDKGWKGMGDWLGTGTIAPRLREYQSFSEAKKFIQSLGLKTNTEWLAYSKGEIPDLPPKPEDIPANPNIVYKDKGWKGIGDWLGTGTVSTQERKYRSFAEAKKFVQSLGLKTNNEWSAYCKGEMPDLPPKPDDIPSAPNQIYKGKGWKGIGDWLGTGTVSAQLREYRSFAEAKKFVQSLGLKSGNEWKAYCKGEMPDLPPKPEDIPLNVNRTYKDKGWKGIGDWLGTGTVSTQERKYRSFADAKKFVQSLELKSGNEWKAYCKGEMPDLPPKPEDIPLNVNRTYKDKGWKSWGDWLGTGTISPQLREYRSFAEAKKFVQSLGLKTGNEWKAYCKGEMPDFSHKPDDIPMKPERVYKDKGWKGMGDWLGKK